MLRLAVRQAGKAASFGEASDDLKHLAQVTISPNHLAKLAERVGRDGPPPATPMSRPSGKTRWPGSILSHPESRR